MLQNKGGEGERQAYQAQLNSMKAQRDREFAQKLEGIKSAVPASAEASSNVNLDPYGGG